MGELFVNLVNRSISASWLVLAVIVLRFLLKKAPKWINPVLWGIVGVRLLCPFSIKSVMSLLPSAKTIDTTRYVGRPYIESGIRAVDRPVNKYLGERYFEAAQVSAPANHFLNVTTILAVIWLIGLLALLLYTFISYRKLQKKVGTAVRLRDNIYESEQVGSPFVLGIFRPHIYLPFQMRETDREHVISHEQTHIRRHDHWIKPFGFLLLSLYWFNPVLWLAYILLCRDIEFACDERVIRELGTDERADYSQALLNCSVSRKIISACPLAFGESGVKERVKNVLNYKKPAFWIIFAAIVSCIAAAVCFLTDPPEKEAAEPVKEAVTPTEAEESWYFGYMGYSGYLDECDAWSANPYGSCDFDSDGLPDRIYREMTEDGENARYRIEFGNGDILDVPKATYDVNCPRFIGVDLTNDGENEILFYLEPGMSNEPRSFGELALFQKVNGSYAEVELPFAESEEGYEQTIEVSYKKFREREIEVSIPAFGYSHVAAINEELWNDYEYQLNYGRGESARHTVWNYEIVDSPEGKKLICKVHLFDKWSTFGLDVTLDYSDGAFQVGDIEFLEDEFEDWDPFHEQEEVTATMVTNEGQIGEDAYHYSKTYPSGAYAAETVVYETTADVTHDGKEDLIQLVICNEGSEKDVKKLLENSVNVAYVKVYRGIDRKKFETAPRFISRMFGLAHTGNGSVFLSHKNGLDYLLFASTYEGQGWADYSYTALYISDETGITTADSKTADFELTDKDPEKSYSENIRREFKQKISPWIEDASVLLIMDIERGAMAASDDKVVSAKSFFDTVLQIDPDIEDWYTDEELMQMAKDYYAAHSNGGSEPEHIEISEGQQTGEVYIWLYDIVAGMGRTRANYTVDRMTAKGYDTVLFNEIDLTEVLGKAPAIASYPIGVHYERESELGEPNMVIPVDEENVIVNKGYFVKAEYEGLTATFHTESDFALNPRSYLISMTAASDAYTDSRGMRVGMSKQKLMQKYSLEEKDFLSGKNNEAQYRLRYDGVTKHNIPEHDSFYVADNGENPNVLIYLIKDERVNAILLRNLTAD